MNKEKTKCRLWLSRLRKVFYWVLPVVILTMIFRRIDLVEFKENIFRSNPWLFALGIAFCPIVIMIGAVRWRTMMDHYLKRKLPMKFMFRHYWIGLAIGWFAPASVGWDIYRVAVLGRRFGRYDLNVAAILFEKFIALLSMVVLIVILYPFVKNLIITNSGLLDQLLRFANIVLVILGVVILGVALLKHHKVMLMISQKLERLIKTTMARAAAVVGLGDKNIQLKLSLSELVRPIITCRPLLQIFLLSVAIQVVSAIRDQIFFQAIGYDIPFVVNLFLVPIFYFIFLLPISFGSLGIREGTCILLYGLFGVPAEVALLVSFFNLSGMLLNNAIGAVLIWYRSPQKILLETLTNNAEFNVKATKKL
jgi:glycosyltransferase 2 family protein